METFPAVEKKVHEQAENSPPRNSTFILPGLDCADCASKLEKRLSQLPGIDSVRVNFGAAKMYVRHTAPIDQIIKGAREAGQQAELAQGTSDQADRPLERQGARIVGTALSGLFLTAGFLTGLWGAAEEITIALYLFAIVTGGLPVIRSGLYALRSLNLDINALMIMAVAGAAAIGEWAEGATVIFLFALGNLLQVYTLGKTRRSIRSLMKLSPPSAMVKRNGQEVTLPVEELQVDDIIIIRPGESIAMDGIVTKGVSAVNQAPITGESAPVDKGPGDTVYAGTINQQGALEVKVNKTHRNTTLAKIIHLVEEAQAKRAPSQQFIDSFARYYTPAVLVGALLTVAVPVLLLGQPFKIWFERALILLVISCPCALVISTPVAIVSAIGSAARKGVLIKGGAFLEKAGMIQTIAMDKTGTLTAGYPEVTDVVALIEQRRLLQLAAGIESRSEHPLAGAITRHARDNNAEPVEIMTFENLAGRGARAVIEGHSYYIGNERMFEEAGIDLGPLGQKSKDLREQGKTVVIIGDDRGVLGLIAAADKPRPNSRRAVESLYRSGIKRVVMLTGDNRDTARSVASAVGIGDYEAELLPQDKLEIIKKLKSGSLTAMVGDGVNDAPALATADIGIAMGGAGTDTAIETADIVLMSDDLSKLSYTVKLGRKSLGIIKQNVIFSIALKGLFIGATILGLATLWMAVFADVGASLLVTLNGMRLMSLKDDI